MKVRYIILLCVQIFVSQYIFGAECCGDKELDTTKKVIGIGRELNDAKSFLENALNSIPYVSDASVDVSGRIEAQDICCNEQIMENGKKELSGTINGSVSVSKVLSPLDIPFTYTIPGTTCTVGLTLRAGPKIGIEAEISLGVSGEINSCSNSRRLSGRANASGNVVVGLVADLQTEACGYSISVEGKAETSTGIMGGVSYDSNGGSRSTICFKDLVADISIKVCVFDWNCSFVIVDEYTLVKGNC